MTAINPWRLMRIPQDTAVRLDLLMGAEKPTIVSESRRHAVESEAAGIARRFRKAKPCQEAHDAPSLMQFENVLPAGAPIRFD
jgi:hypothetical protein